MPSFDEVIQHIFLGIFYDIGKHWLLYFLAIGAINLIVRRFTTVLKTYKDVLVLWVCSFILLSTAAYVIGSRPLEPAFAGAIQTAQAGPSSNNRDTIFMLSMSIINTGTMQSVATAFSVDAVVEGNKYQGAILPIPQSFTFSSPNAKEDEPVAVTYHSEDNIVNKAVTPIQPGALLAGIIMVDFKDININAFRVGATITVHFVDIFSKPYSESITMTGKVDALPTVTGLHTEQVCRAPADLLKQLQPPQSVAPTGPQTPLPQQPKS